jgi:glutamine amidotransferase
MIVIVDYGMGNLRSVQKGFQSQGIEALVSKSPSDISKAEKLVVPGVGAFGDAMEELTKRKLADPIRDSIKQGKPFLGLCLGLQLLFEVSSERGRHKGLGILEGEVKRFQPGLKIPHMGWNQVKFKGQCSIFKGIEDESYFYFVHSYYVEPKDQSVASATTDYGIEFASAVCKDNIYGLQFHPEKSQDLGLKMLKNFGELK